MLCAGEIAPGIALDNDAAAHYVGTELGRVVTARSTAGGYTLRLADGEVREAPLPAVDLSAADAESGYSEPLSDSSGSSTTRT